MSIQLLPHTYIHLQVEGTDFIFGKSHETGCSDIHLVIFGLSQRHLQHHHTHTLLTQTQVMIIDNHTLCSDDTVSFEILSEHHNSGQFISSSRKSAMVVGIGPCIIQVAVAIHIKKNILGDV